MTIALINFEYMKRLFLVIMVLVTSVVGFAQNDGNVSNHKIDVKISDTIIGDIGFKYYRYSYSTISEGLNLSYHMYLNGDYIVPIGKNNALKKIADSVFCYEKSHDGLLSYMNYEIDEFIKDFIIEGNSNPDSDPEYTLSCSVGEYIVPISIGCGYIAYSYEEYYNEAYPRFSKSVKVFDINTGKTVKLEDLFSEINENTLQEAYNEHTSASNNDLWVSENYQSCINDGFYVTSEGLFLVLDTDYFASHNCGNALFVRKELLKPFTKKNTPLYNYWFGKGSK